MAKAAFFTPQWATAPKIGKIHFFWIILQAAFAGLWAKSLPTSQQILEPQLQAMPTSLLSSQRKVNHWILYRRKSIALCAERLASRYLPSSIQHSAAPPAIPEFSP